MEDKQTILELKTNLHKSIENTKNINILRSIFYLIESHKQSEQNEFKDIPDFHKTILKERLEDYKQNPKTSIEWDTAKIEIEKLL